MGGLVSENYPEYVDLTSQSRQRLPTITTLFGGFLGVKLNFDQLQQTYLDLEPTRPAEDKGLNSELFWTTYREGRKPPNGVLSAQREQWLYPPSKFKGWVWVPVLLCTKAVPPVLSDTLMVWVTIKPPGDRRF